MFDIGEVGHSKFPKPSGKKCIQIPCICPVDRDPFEVTGDHYSRNELATAVGRFKIVKAKKVVDDGDDDDDDDDGDDDDDDDDDNDNDDDDDVDDVDDVWFE